MRIRPLVLVFAFFLLASSSVFAQTSPTAASPTEKDKAAKELEKNGIELLDQIAGDAGSLKLWENRALIDALVADLLWEKDKKRARELFRNSANELMQANNQPVDKNKPEDSIYFGMMGDASPRKTVLQMIAKRDADLALQFLLETRPAKVQEAINAANLAKTQPAKPKTADDFFSGRSQQMQVQQEISLEQSFAARAAEQDPKKAAQLLRDSLSKGVTYEVFGLLEKVNKNDAELAQKLTGEVVAKILEIDFTKDESGRSVAIGFLNRFGGAAKKPAADAPANSTTATDKAGKDEPKNAPLKVDDKLLKDTANKLADFLLQAKGFDAFFLFSQLMPVLEKFVPEKMPQLKQKQTEIRKQMPAEMLAMQDSFGAAFNNIGSAPPEKMIADAAKMPAFARARIYNQAIDKMAAAGETEKARATLQALPDGKERDSALAYLDSKMAGVAMEKGNLDEAQKIINQIGSDKEKVEQLVNLAVKFHQKNTKEGHEAALKLMEDARRLVNEFAENKDEVAGVLKLAAGYAIIEPERAFPLLSPLIEQANDVIGANALLAKYNKREQSFRAGEMLMSSSGFGGSNFARYGKELKTLAQTDYGKTKGLIDQFRRDDVRVLLKMLLAQSILSDKIGFEGTRGSAFAELEESGIIISN